MHTSSRPHPPFCCSFTPKIPRYLVWTALFLSLYIFGSLMVGNDHRGHYIWSDAEGYYMYLPAAFIHGTFEGISVRTTDQFDVYPGTQKIFTKYTYGVAALEAPFFFGAYASRMIQGMDPNDYFSNDYSVALLVAGCFYGVLGLFLLGQVLRQHFRRHFPVYLTLLIILLGTNLLYYMTRAPGMSHVYSFFLFSWLIYLTPAIFSKPGYGRFFGYGLIFGLIVLIRPTNGIILIYPVLYGIQSLRGGGIRRFDFIKKHWPKLLVAAVPVAAVWIPQMYYWYYLSGNILLDSYAAESFIYWKNPKIGQVLTSSLNGYFTYNPVMVLPVACLPFLLKNNKLNSWAILLIFAISTYVYASWWCWWFGGAFGHRCYVELIAVLCFPLCFVVEKILVLRKAWIKTVSLAAIAILVYYNFHCTLIYEWTWSHFDWTAEKYWEEVFGKIFFM